MRVLVVDDSADAVLILGRLLGAYGHEIQTAESGEEALRIAPAFQPEAAFIDLWMPIMDGYELSKRLRQIEGMSGIRIIAMSGINPDLARDADSGIDRHLLKPSGVNEMLGALLREPA